jgi:hypothetical protein
LSKNENITFDGAMPLWPTKWRIFVEKNTLTVEKFINMVGDKRKDEKFTMINWHETTGKKDVSFVAITFCKFGRLDDYIQFFLYDGDYLVHVFHISFGPNNYTRAKFLLEYGEIASFYFDLIFEMEKNLYSLQN